MDLPALEVIEFDVSDWETPPSEWMFHWVLLDFYMYAPTLHEAVFWVDQTRISWHLPARRDQANYHRLDSKVLSYRVLQNTSRCRKEYCRQTTLAAMLAAL